MDRRIRSIFHHDITKIFNSDLSILYHKRKERTLLMFHESLIGKFNEFTENYIKLR